MTDPLKRIDVNKPANELLTWVASEFGLGKVKEFSVMKKGLDRANFKVTTTNNTYLIKISSNKEHSLASSQEFAEASKAVYDCGIPVPDIYMARNGNRIASLKLNSKRTAYACVMEWFYGEDFTEQEPTDGDLRSIAKTIADINRLDLKFQEEYDSFYVLNLPKEYHKLKYVSKKYREYITDSLHKLNDIDFSRFRNGFMHQDVHREHVLKGKTGLCFIDFMLRTGPIAIDLAIAMSEFCFEIRNATAAEFLRRYGIMLKEYTKYITLSNYEIELLPTLIKANYAMYLLAASYFARELKEERGKFWEARTKKGLDLFYSMDDEKFR